MPVSLTGSASRTDLLQLTNGIWKSHVECSCFLCLHFLAKIGHISQFKASSARVQHEVLPGLMRMSIMLIMFNGMDIFKTCSCDVVCAHHR